MQFDFNRQPAVAEASASFSQPNVDIPDDEGLYPSDFNPLSPPNLPVFMSSSAYSNNLYIYTDAHSDSASDSNSNSFHGEEEEDPSNFVTGIFVSRKQECGVDDPDSFILDAVTRDVNFRAFDGNDGHVSGHGNELGFGFGSRIEFDRVAFSSELSESPSATRGANSSSDGLRVVGIESDSDSDEVGRDGYDPLDDSDFPLIWDCLGFGEQRTSNEEESQWEEVHQSFNNGEGWSSIMNRTEYLSVSSEVSINDESDIDEETAQSLEWEFLLAVHSDFERSHFNLARAHQMLHEGGDVDGVTYLAASDEDTYAAEYDMVFGQFAQNESGLKGTPPAAKNVVETLPVVALTKEDLRENNVVCAVCKDEILADVKVTRLPCCHHYHGACIVPWLCIRNTCPVCRYELPTDDLDYEQRKIQRGEGLGLPLDLQTVFTRL